MRSFAAAVVFSLFASLTAPAFAAPGSVPWDLARKVIRSGNADSAGDIVALLDRGGDDAVAGAKLMRVIGVTAPQVFAAIFARADLVEAGRVAVLDEIAHMPDSDARAKLLALAKHAPSVITADR